MAGENYTNTSSVATTAAPIGPSDTSVTLNNFSGYPSAPFWGELEKGTTSAEIVRVTNVAGSTLTITRGQGGTGATSHGAGVNFELVAPADFFNRTETHLAATNAHGVTGNVVGTSGAQTVQDKLFRGGFKAQNSDTLPVGLTASFESLADDASAQDGFVHRNTAGDAARSGFLLQQSGTDRFKVRNTGTVDINPGADANPGLRNAGTTQLDGNATVGGTLGVTGATTLSGGVTTTTAAADSASVTGAVSAGSVSTTGAVHAGGNLDTDGTLVVDGTSTLTGAVTAGAGVTVAQNVTSWGGVLVPSVPSTASVTSPVDGMVIFDQSALVFKRRTGGAWAAVEPPYAHLRQTIAQNISSLTWTDVVFDLGGEDLDNVNGHVSGGTAARYTCQRAGVYMFSGGGAYEANTSGSRTTRWALNGVAIPGSQGPGILGADSSSVGARTILKRLIVGDYVTLQTLQSSGVTLATSTASDVQFSLSALWVAP